MTNRPRDKINGELARAVSKSVGIMDAAITKLPKAATKSSQAIQEPNGPLNPARPRITKPTPKAIDQPLTINIPLSSKLRRCKSKAINAKRRLASDHEGHRARLDAFEFDSVGFDILSE